jgi:Uma2 family endonuclease
MLHDCTMTIEPQPSDIELMELADRLNMTLEVTKEGKIRMMTPHGSKSSDANAEIITQLRIWWYTHEQGRVYDSNTLFELPDGSKRGPDAAFISAERLANISSAARDTWPPVCPNFVVELLSKTDSLREAQQKMCDWIENGVELGWLIDPYQRRAYAYTAPGVAREMCDANLRGTGPVDGFTLDLNRVWRAYE